MNFLTCFFCDGELEILNLFDNFYIKKVKCLQCGFTSNNKYERKEKQPEVFIKRR